MQLVIRMYLRHIQVLINRSVNAVRIIPYWRVVTEFFALTMREMALLSKSMAMSTIHSCSFSVISVRRSAPSSTRAVRIVAGLEQSLQYRRLQNGTWQRIALRQNSRDHSFPRAAEFRAEPRNLAVAAEFPCFRGISRNSRKFREMTKFCNSVLLL